MFKTEEKVLLKIIIMCECPLLEHIKINNFKQQLSPSPAYAYDYQSS